MFQIQNTGTALKLAIPQCIDADAGTVTIKKPGAHNKARWMCVCIYSLKMFWYQDEEVLHYSDEYKARLNRFVKFLLLIYIPYWFKTPLSSDAAVHDLNLYKLLMQYHDIDSEISLTVLRVQARHYWYLSPESIILWSMFGTELSEDEKGQIAAVLLTKPRPANFEPKKVKFPVLTPTTTIHSLISSMSWFPFDLLGLSPKWLELPPSQWDQDPDYREMEKFARSVKLTNDIAERGVKLISDYSDKLTKDSDERKKLVMVVQNHRQAFPAFRKKDLVENNNKDLCDEEKGGDDESDGGENNLEQADWSDSDSEASDY